MGKFQFRKRIKIAKGVSLNLSKRGAGVSAGPRGAKISRSADGRLTGSAGIPGSGVSYRRSLNGIDDSESGTKKQKTQKDTNEVYRKGMKFLAITFTGLLLLTGCSTASTDPEQAIKLLEYEKCLELQQGLNNQLNKSLSEVKTMTLTEILTIVSNQGELDETGKLKRFEIHLENCLPYRP